MTVLSVVVPTRNEVDNVAPLVVRTCAALAPLGLDWDLVFADDSDDGTPQQVMDAARAGYPVRLVHRGPGDRAGGLGGAVAAAFDLLAGSEVVAVMDGDHQHRPELLVDLVVTVRGQGADIAIASRGLNAGRLRRMTRWRGSMSLGSRLLVRLAFPGLRSLADPLAGFFAMDGGVVRDRALRPEGFKILLEVLVRGSWTTVVELPHELEPRLHGKSKAQLGQALAFARHLVRLRRRLPVALTPASGPIAP